MEMSSKVKYMESLIDKLQKRLELLRQYRNEKSAFDARLNLEEFICSTDEFVPFLHTLINQGKITPKALGLLYNDYMTLPSLRDQVNNRGELRTMTMTKNCKS
jgi:hypothetical protein